MNITPDIEEVRRYAKEGKFDVLPLCTEILSDFTTPIETIRILKGVSKHCYLLESAGGGAIRSSATNPDWL